MRSIAVVESRQQTRQNEVKYDVAIDSSTGFPPLAGHDAHVLILGSLPGQRSLQAGQYYAHPQNAFWRIMQEVAGAEGSYERRCKALVQRGIALWDVLAHSVRLGSMDADIRLESAEANDLVGFLAEYLEIRLICFNGQKAAKLFQRFVGPEVTDAMLYETLPSTSPAYASMPYVDKLAKWRNIINQTILERRDDDWLCDTGNEQI